MDTPKQQGKTFDFVINIREKKIPPSEYIILKKAFLEGLQVTREWLLNIEKNNPVYKERIDKVLRNINFESLDYEMRMVETLKTDENEELFKFLDSIIVTTGAVMTISTSNKQKISDLKQSIISKEELKKEINELYQQKDNYDLCINKTAELLQHPDLTEEEKTRYTKFYHELLEWINLKNKKQEQSEDKLVPTNAFESSTIAQESRSTSISVLRNNMLKELQKLREIYIDKEE